jgi:hypothetical protein
VHRDRAFAILAALGAALVIALAAMAVAWLWVPGLPVVRPVALGGGAPAIAAPKEEPPDQPGVPIIRVVGNVREGLTEDYE